MKQKTTRVQDVLTSRVNIMTSNLSEAISFYTAVLNFKLLNKYGEHYAEVQAPDLLIGLHIKSKETVLGNNATLGFRIANIEAMVDYLISNGVTCSLQEDGWVRLAYFTDPDGNVLFLAEE